MSAISTVAGGFAQGGAANYQAHIASNNAIIARQNATAATQAGEVQAQAKSLEERGRGGAIKAAEAAGNVDVNSGSASDVQESQRELGELDTQTTINNAALKAYGYRNEATADEAQSNLDSAVATEAPIGGVLAGTGGLLSSASSLGFKWSGTQYGPGAWFAGESYDPSQTYGYSGSNGVGYGAA